MTRTKAINVCIGIMTLKNDHWLIAKTSFYASAVMTNGKVNAEKLG